MTIISILNSMALKSISPVFFKAGICLIDFTGIILLIAVFFKFVEHFLTVQKLNTNKNHFFSTFAMTLLVLVLFNFWNSSIGQLNIQENATKYIYFGLGSILILFGTYLHIWSKISIGRFWSDSIEIKTDHYIVKTGAYLIARHPMYASLLMWCFGASFAMFNWITLLITAVIFFPLMIVRAKAEEKELLNVDSSYTLFKENVKMLCPTLKGATAIIIRIFALIIFTYFVITGIDLSKLILLFFVQMYLGLSLTPEKVAFSYRSKSFIMVIVWLISNFLWSPIYYFYYIMILMFAYGLKWNCPCMIVYEKFGGCPCIKPIKNFLNKP